MVHSVTISSRLVRTLDLERNLWSKSSKIKGRIRETLGTTSCSVIDALVYMLYMSANGLLALVLGMVKLGIKWQIARTPR